eukprot:scaffold4800_cov327-Prasinococcus_capsulatus_cf.AAC.2
MASSRLPPTARCERLGSTPAHRNCGRPSFRAREFRLDERISAALLMPHRLLAFPDPCTTRMRRTTWHRRKPSS